MQIKLATACNENEQRQGFDVLLTVRLSMILVINLLAPELFFLNFSTRVYKM